MERYGILRMKNKDFVMYYLYDRKQHRTIGWLPCFSLQEARAEQRKMNDGKPKERARKRRVCFVCGKPAFVTHYANIRKYCEDEPIYSLCKKHERRLGHLRSKLQILPYKTR